MISHLKNNPQVKVSFQKIHSSSGDKIACLSIVLVNRAVLHTCVSVDTPISGPGPKGQKIASASHHV